MNMLPLARRNSQRHRRIIAPAVWAGAHCDLPCGVHKAQYLEKYRQLNDLLNKATELAGAGGTKGSTDVAVADRLFAKIDEIDAVLKETKRT